MSGRFTGRSQNLVLSFSPLWTGTHFCRGWIPIFNSCRGDSQGSVFVSILVLPTVILRHPKLGHLWGILIYTGLRDGWSCHPSYMYIYSLGHFLTTKGALIDGDAYPPKVTKKGSKKGQKMIKFEVKNESKNTILNGKIDFFTTIDKKGSKNDQKSTQN